jgi:hypothetical protein
MGLLPGTGWATRRCRQTLRGLSGSTPLEAMALRLAPCLSKRFPRPRLSGDSPGRCRASSAGGWPGGLDRRAVQPSSAVDDSFRGDLRARGAQRTSQRSIAWERDCPCALRPCSDTCGRDPMIDNALHISCPRLGRRHEVRSTRPSRSLAELAEAGIVTVRQHSATVRAVSRGTWKSPGSELTELPWTGLRVSGIDRAPAACGRAQPALCALRAIPPRCGSSAMGHIATRSSRLEAGQQPARRRPCALRASRRRWSSQPNLRPPRAVSGGCPLMAGTLMAARGAGRTARAGRPPDQPERGLGTVRCPVTQAARSSSRRAEPICLRRDAHLSGHHEAATSATSLETAARA